MRRTVALMPLMALLLLAGTALAESGKAASVRRELGLVPYDPPAAFLEGYFIADEMAPLYLFGPVKDFVAGRAGKTAWLIEEGEKNRLLARDPANPVFEYTLYLEEDDGSRVTDYVFLDQSAMTPKQWIDWRRQFHKNKAEPEYADAVRKLQKAIEGGFPVRGEMRFVLRDGELDPASPQELLPVSLACPPRYDCVKGEPVK